MDKKNDDDEDEETGIRTAVKQYIDARPELESLDHMEIYVASDDLEKVDETLISTYEPAIVASAVPRVVIQKPLKIERFS